MEEIRKEEEMLEMMLLVVLKFVFPIILLVSLSIWCVRFFVKLRRCHLWVEEHGYLIGSDEFFDWCKFNKVDPAYFI